MKLPLLFALLSASLYLSCSNIDTNTRVTQKQFDYPVLKLKNFNNILQINIKRSDTTQATILQKIVINTKGTALLADIESVALYHTGENSGLLDETRVLYSETNQISSTITLKGSFKLKGDNNFFWLSYKLKDNADLLHHVCGYCESAITNHGKVVVNELDDPKVLRIGAAVRKHGDNNVNTYRIPGLVTTNNGTLLAVYDIRRNSRRDLQGDIDIGISRSTDGGNSWEPMTIALDMGEWGNLPQKFNGVSDASLLVDRKSGNIFVAALWMYGIINEDGEWIKNLTVESDEWNHQWRNRGSQPGFGVKETSQFLIAKSSDDGMSWEKPVNLTRMCKKIEWWLWAPAPGSGITLNDETLILPTQGRDKEGLPFSNITYSNDGGISWKTSKPAYHNTTECAVVQLDDNTLMLNMRYNNNRNNEGSDNGRAIATTSDFGETWIEHPTSHRTLNEPVCMASLYKHNYIVDGQQKSVLLFSNPNTKKDRHHLTIKASIDNGNTWPEKYWQLLDEGYGSGYSCITSVDENNIGILYEGSQANLTFQKIPLKEILK